MKKLINLILFTVLIFAYSSCTKQETVAYYIGGTKPVLSGISNSGSSTINLSASDSASTAISLSWTNPNYTFNYGASSLNVSYLLEIDTSGSNFTNPHRGQIGISQSTNVVMTITQINAVLTNSMNLDTSSTHKLEIRIAAYIVTTGPGADTLYSNVLSYNAKPYFPPPAVNPPSSGTLYLVGGLDIMNGIAWNNSDPFLPGYQFTQITPKLYTITVHLSGGDNTSGDDQFLFLPKAGDWTHKYACKKTANQPASGGSFGYDFSDNFPGPESAGTYKITVDFQLGIYTVIKQ